MTDKFTIPSDIPAWVPDADVLWTYRNDPVINLVVQKLATTKDHWQVLHMLDSIRKDDYLRARVIAFLTRPSEKKPYQAYPYDSLR